MKRWLTMLTLLLGGLAITPNLAAAASTRAIQGIVVDGTAGASLTAGLVAHLNATGTGQAPYDERSATVGADGRFGFDNVPVDPAFADQITIDYGGATYRVAVPAATASAPTTVSVQVFESTTAEDVLRIDSANWLVESIDDVTQQVVILETMNLVNGSDRAYIGDHRGDPGSDAPGVLPRTLRLYLPTGASDFQPAAGLNQAGLLPVAGGFVDTEPVLPGVRQVAYTYRMVYADGGLEIRKALPYPTQKLRVLVPNIGLEFRADLLKSAGSIDLQGRSYVVLTTDGVAANTNVTLDMFGFPNVPVGRLDPQTMTTVGLSVVGLATVTALILGLRSNRPTTDHAKANG